MSCRGMGTLVDTTFGQYPQFLPTFPSGGMGDYLVAKPGAYPQFLQPGLGSLLPASSQLPVEFLGAKGMNGGCGCCGVSGLTMDGTGLFGTGLFAGGTDVSTWGYGEWGVLAVGFYMLFSTFSTTKRGYSRAKQKVKRLRS
jgi:hypothetical protein